jgi:hypothetical protein
LASIKFSYGPLYYDTLDNVPLKNCQKPTKYGQVMFYEAIKVYVVNSKEELFSHTISSTLSLITVVFEDLFKAINIHKDCCDEKQNLNHPSHYWIKPLHVMIRLQCWIHQQWWLHCTPKRIVDVVGGLMHLWSLGIIQKFGLYFGGSKQDHVLK